MSTRTVSRRLARLARARLVPVACLPNAADGELTGPLLRARVRRGGVGPIANALARRADVPIVDIAAGAEEISGVAVAERGPPAPLLVDRLPATPAVTSVSTHAVLRVSAPPSRPPGPVDAVDRRPRVLATDARIGPGPLTVALGLPESTVRRRLDRLAATGRLRTHATVDPGLRGLAVDANLWLRVPPGRLDAIGRALAAHPATHGVLATTGSTSLMAAVCCPDLPALHRFLTNRAARSTCGRRR